jgi:ABC-type uncharacterized transport system permease subunit
MSISGWTVLAVLAIVAVMVFYQRGRVWGGLSLGIIIGFVIALVYVFQGNTFAWEMIIKAAIIGALAGAITEWVGLFLKQRRGEQNKQ